MLLQAALINKEHLTESDPTEKYLPVQKINMY